MELKTNCNRKKGNTLTGKGCLCLHKICGQSWSLYFKVAEIIFAFLQDADERWAGIIRDRSPLYPFKNRQLIWENLNPA